MGPQTCCQHASWRQPSCVTPHPSSFLLLIVFGLHPSSDGLQPKCCKNCLVFTVWFSVSKRRLSPVKAWRASATMPSGTTCHKRFHVRFRFQFWSGHLLLFFLPFCFLLGTRMLLGAKGIVLSLSLSSFSFGRLALAEGVPRERKDRSLSQPSCINTFP